MMLRIVGVFVFLVGAVLIALSIWAFATVGHDAAYWASSAAASGDAFDPDNWSRHWLSFSALMGTMGIFIALAGAAVFIRCPSGLLLVSGAAAFAAVGPWLYQLLGLASYGYEQNNAGWTAVLIAIGLTFLLWHFISRRRLPVGA